MFGEKRGHFPQTSPRPYFGDRLTMLPPSPPSADVESGLPTSPARLRVRMDNALASTRLLGVIMLIVLSGLVARTLIFSRETPGERALSEMYDKFLVALSTTKNAYSPDLITDPQPKFPPQPLTKSAAPSHDNIKLHGVQNSTDGSGTGGRGMLGSAPRTLNKTTTASVALTKSREAAAASARPAPGADVNKTPSAIREWQELTQSRYARAGEWRRLAIVRALFGQAGALDAIAHIDDPLPILPGVPRRAARVTGNLRAALQKGARTADPFGHGAVGVSSADEHAFWNALYGPKPLAPARVPALRQTLLQLHLGWFTDVALAQLYQKAGMKTEARQAALDADHTAGQVRSYTIVQVLSLLLGIVGAAFTGFAAFVRWTQRDSRGSQVVTPQAAPAYDFDFVLPGVTSAFAGGTQAAVLGPARSDRAFALFPDSALLLAFVVYLLGHTFLGLGVSLALRPFVAHLEDWSASSLLHLETALEIGLYLPIFLLPLLALRSRIAFDPLSGARPHLRVLLARLGYHTRNIAAEVGVGAWAYLLTLPAYLLISLLSHWMFQRFHTPVNPAQFETLTAHGGLDKALVFLMAAVLAPIVEETMFRGLLYSALRRRFGVGGAAALSAAVFAAVHPTLPGGFLPIWCLGVALALVYERRGSLLPGMVLHGIHNGLIVMMGFAVFGS